MVKTLTLLIPSERIESRIYFIRGKKVMVDRDLAELYGVTTGRFNEQVTRNSTRFPDDDFMFQLTALEFRNFQILISQNAISNRGGTRKPPRVFTEQGVAMLASVLNSERAIQVNIQIIKTFTRLRRLIASNKEILEKVERMERKYDAQFKEVFDAIRKLFTPPEEPPKRRIGFGVQ